MQESFLWWQYVITLPPPPQRIPPSPNFPPSLIRIMASVDIKHHIDLLQTRSSVN